MHGLLGSNDKRKRKMTRTKTRRTQTRLTNQRWHSPTIQSINLNCSNTPTLKKIIQSEEQFRRRKLMCTMHDPITSHGQFSYVSPGFLWLWFGSFFSALSATDRLNARATRTQMAAEDDNPFFTGNVVR